MATDLNSDRDYLIDLYFDQTVTKNFVHELGMRCGPRLLLRLLYLCPDIDFELGSRLTIWSLVRRGGVPQLVP